MEKVIELFQNDKFAEHCGIRIVEVSAGFAVCSMEVTEKHLNGIGILMGGALFTLADFTFGLAANSHGTIAVSLNAFVSYIKKCSSGTITATAKEISNSRKTGVYSVCVNDETGQIIAQITGTCYFTGKQA